MCISGKETLALQIWTLKDLFTLVALDLTMDNRIGHGVHRKADGQNTRERILQETYGKEKVTLHYVWMSHKNSDLSRELWVSMEADWIMKSHLGRSESSPHIVRAQKNDKSPATPLVEAGCSQRFGVA